MWRYHSHDDLPLESSLIDFKSGTSLSLLLQPSRDDYGKDVDGVNWDILNAGNRTGMRSGSGASATGAAATERGQGLPLRQSHLVSLPLVPSSN